MGWANERRRRHGGSTGRRGSRGTGQGAGLRAATGVLLSALAASCAAGGRDPIVHRAPEPEPLRLLSVERDARGLFRFRLSDGSELAFDPLEPLSPPATSDPHR